VRVLLVEDDAATASLLERALREDGNAVVVERNGLLALDLAGSNSFDVMVLDVMLPGLDGYGVMRRLRKNGSHIPTLMLTARDTNRDVIQGLDVGADDYLTKPFALDVFFARLRAVSRRAHSPLSLILSVENLNVNTATREVHRGDRLLQLTRTEYLLLELLLKSACRIVPRERIIEAVWGFGAEVESNTLDAFVHLLRAKVDAPGESKLIHTIRGVGYCLREIRT
jgi:DNA-binding response OmpR family regulator